MYQVVKTMKSIPRYLSLRSFAPASPAPRLSLSTNTVSSSPPTVYLRLNHRQLSTMPPPPKRKWPRPKGGDRSNGATTQNPPAARRPPIAQQPKRPRVEDTLPEPVDTVDVRQMYSTAAGEAAPKPFSVLQNKLHQGLLDGLDKMGFE